MKSFVFQFDSLLQYRRHRRDLCRQLLAEVLENSRRLQEHQELLRQQREGQLAEIRAMYESGSIDVDRSSARKYYAGQMQVDIGLVDREQGVVEDQLVHCRQALLEADREVKVLEKLRDKQHSRFALAQNRRETRELDEVWMAGHLGLANR